MPAPHPNETPANPNLAPEGAPPPLPPRRSPTFRTTITVQLPALSNMVGEVFRRGRDGLHQPAWNPSFDDTAPGIRWHAEASGYVPIERRHQPPPQLPGPDVRHPTLVRPDVPSTADVPVASAPFFQPLSEEEQRQRDGEEQLLRALEESIQEQARIIAQERGREDLISHVASELGVGGLGVRRAADRPHRHDRRSSSAARRGGRRIRPGLDSDLPDLRHRPRVPPLEPGPAPARVAPTIDFAPVASKGQHPRSRKYASTFGTPPLLPARPIPEKPFEAEDEAPDVQAALMESVKDNDDVERAKAASKEDDDMEKAKVASLLSITEPAPQSKTIEEELEEFDQLQKALELSRQQESHKGTTPRSRASRRPRDLCTREERSGRPRALPPAAISRKSDQDPGLAAALAASVQEKKEAEDLDLALRLSAKQGTATYDPIPWPDTPISQITNRWVQPPTPTSPATFKIPEEAAADDPELAVALYEFAEEYAARLDRELARGLDAMTMEQPEEAQPTYPNSPPKCPGPPTAQPPVDPKLARLQELGHLATHETLEDAENFNDALADALENVERHRDPWHSPLSTADTRRRARIMIEFQRQDPGRAAARGDEEVYLSPRREDEHVEDRNMVRLAKGLRKEYMDFHSKMPERYMSGAVPSDEGPRTGVPGPVEWSETGLPGDDKPDKKQKRKKKGGKGKRYGVKTEEKTSAEVLGAFGEDESYEIIGKGKQRATKLPGVDR